MDWFLHHWQTIVAFAIVAFPVAIFALRLTRPKKKSGCGGGCDCEGKKL